MNEKIKKNGFFSKTLILLLVFMLSFSALSFAAPPPQADTDYIKAHYTTTTFQNLYKDGENAYGILYDGISTYYLFLIKADLTKTYDIEGAVVGGESKVVMRAYDGSESFGPTNSVYKITNLQDATVNYQGAMTNSNLAYINSAYNGIELTFVNFFVGGIIIDNQGIIDQNGVLDDEEDQTVINNPFVFVKTAILSVFSGIGDVFDQLFLGVETLISRIGSLGSFASESMGIIPSSIKTLLLVGVAAVILLKIFGR